MSDFAGLSVPMLKNLLFVGHYTAQSAEKQEPRRSLAAATKADLPDPRIFSIWHKGSFEFSVLRFEKMRTAIAALRAARRGDSARTLPPPRVEVASGDLPRVG